MAMPPRGRPRSVSDDAVLDKALAMFADAGYAAMSVRALNSELGLSHEAVSQRFGPKSDLFGAAVRRGMDLFMSDFNREIERCSPADDLQRLHATVRAFMVAASRHPALGRLLHHNSIGDEERVVLMRDTGLAESIAETVALLGRLYRAGLIRQTGIRELWFLAEGSVAPLHSPGLSQMFDPYDGPVEEKQLIDRMSAAVMRSVMS